MSADLEKYLEVWSDIMSWNLKTSVRAENLCSQVLVHSECNVSDVWKAAP